VGETHGYDVADHVTAVQQHIPDIEFDVVLANDNFSVPEDALGNTILVKLSELEDIRLVTADLVDTTRPWRHDSQKLANVVMSLLPS
jgi:2-phospho-L-lactate transferase/gluconeogenesis factor (CofD/UPF0052 family)